VLARNGTRHPQLNSCASDRLPLISRNAPIEKNKPAGAPNCGNMPYQACLPLGAFSVASSTAPPHSPPKPRPCPTRQSARSTAAHTPMEAYVGNSPMQIVDTPMVSNAVTKVVLRPTRSPK
jgi:hypothetical protein